MYEIKIGEASHYAASPHWVRQLTALGKAVGLPVTTIRESEAQGILFGHAYYTLLSGDGEPLMQGDFAAATVTRVEQPQQPLTPDFEMFKQIKLTENSELCRSILETEFKSAVKGDGLQSYRMNSDDRENLAGMVGLINTQNIAVMSGEMKPEDIRVYYSWSNAKQLVHDDDWHFSLILGLAGEFAEWKELVLKRQDEIKYAIHNADTSEKLDEITIDYSDLLTFGGDDGE